MGDKKKLDTEKKDKAKVNRGTNNDMEVLAIIVGENIGLRKRVLDKIKQSRDAKDRREGKKEKKAVG